MYFVNKMFIYELEESEERNNYEGTVELVGWGVRRKNHFLVYFL
jgi:hypothetical protein